MLKTKAIPPHPLLAPYVECYFITTPGAGHRPDFIYRDLPSGHGMLAFMVWEWVPTGKQEKPFAVTRASFNIFGPHQQMVEVPVEGPECSGIRILPGGFKALLGVPANLIQNRLVSMESLWGKPGAELFEKLCVAPSAGARLRLMEECLLHRLALSNDHDLFTMEAVKYLQRMKWKVSLRELSAKMGYSERQVRREFEEWSGLSPKKFIRTLRCREIILRAISMPQVDWASLASEYGYYDQAHFIHDFQQTMNQTPGEFLKDLGSRYNPMEGQVVEGQDATSVLIYRKDNAAALDQEPPKMKVENLDLHAF